MRPTRSQIVALLMAALVLPATAAVGQAGNDEAGLRAIHSRLSAELMSPFCHGLTLENCPTSGAAEMRDQIWAWLQEGRSEDWIVDTLVDEWGETILGAPRFRGIGVVAWLAPGAMLLVAGAALVYWLRRSVGGEETAPVPADAASADPRSEALQQQVDEELGALAD